MIVAPNPGPKTLTGTNTYLVGAYHAILIDPGPFLPEHLQAVARRFGGRIDSMVLTHGHPDHADGASYLASMLDVPVWMSSEVKDEVRQAISNAHTLKPRQIFWAGDCRLATILAPGHSGDHVCFLVEPSRILLSGDTILGSGSTLIAPPDGDMVAYMRTLARLLSLQATVIAPGHGPLVYNPDAKIREYITHRLMREREIVSALALPATSSQLVDRVYGQLAPEIRHLALMSVEAQLDKLRLEEVVVEREGLYCRLAASS